MMDEKLQSDVKQNAFNMGGGPLPQHIRLEFMNTLIYDFYILLGMMFVVRTQDFIWFK